MGLTSIDEDVSKADSDALERAEQDLAGVFGDGRVPLPLMRDRLDAMMSSSGLPVDTTVTEMSAGGVPALRVAAGSVDESAVVIWFHGGGYVIGSADGYRGVAAAVSAACGHPVVVPDYRRAPEDPFPAALHDARAVMEWAARTYGNRWVLAGDSAGGGLTIASLLRARDEATPSPAAAVVVSPLADFTASGASFDVHAATDVAISRRSVKSLGHAYLGGHDPRDPYVSPVFGVLDRMPPTLIMASDREVLLDDAQMLHSAMQRDGSPSTLSVYSGVCHAWTMFTSYMPLAQRAVGEIGAFVRDALGRGFRDAMASVCTPVAVITAMDDARPHGTTVSAFASLSMSPPSLLVSLDQGSDLLALIRRTGRFGVNVLGSDQSSLASCFASKGREKFAGVDWTLTDDVPRLAGAPGWFACEVDQLIEAADHVVVTGVVRSVDSSGSAPLTYHGRTFGTHQLLSAGVGDDA